MNLKERYTLAFQNLLFHEPLYRFVETDESTDGKQGRKKKMNVVAIGWNLATEVFVDQCLQAGQMDTLDICVSVVTEEASKSEEEYTNARPAMAKFVNIDGSLNDSGEEPYGELRFVSYPKLGEAVSDKSRREEDLMNILAELEKVKDTEEGNNGQSPEDLKDHYFLISVGDDDANREIACLLDSIATSWNLAGPHTVHYVLEKSTSVPEEDIVTPICAIGFEAAEDIDPELDRIAFNVHLGWQDVIQGDNKSLYKKFKGQGEADIYNYCSSVAMALSIKYKLADVPDLEMTEDYSDREALDRTAESFAQMLAEGDRKELLLRLTALEHRRWVIYMAADGWQAPDPAKMKSFYNECFDRQNLKDKKRKLHLCMVRSTADTSLESKDKHFWDNAVSDGRLKEELDALDELDHVSVMTHWRMHVKAEKYFDSDPMNKGTIKEIQDMLNVPDIDEDVKREWKRFRFCLGNILDGNLGYSKKYEYYRDSFLSLCGEKNVPFRDDLVKKIKILNKEIWPAIQANQYIDYKKYDAENIWKIPFFLTYRRNMTLALPFFAGKSSVSVGDILFRHVASVTVIRPERILYLVNLSEGSRPDFFRQRVIGVRNYFANRDMDCEIHVIAVASAELSEEENDAWIHCFDYLKDENEIQSSDLMVRDPGMDPLEVWNDRLNLWIEENTTIDMFDGTFPLFESVHDNIAFLEMIQGREGSNKMPCFEFDSRKKEFRHNESCHFLSYIDDQSYLGVEEMFALSDLEITAFIYPGLSEDYPELWKIYKGVNRGYGDADRNEAILCWKNLCTTLKNIAKRRENNGIRTDQFLLSDLDDQLENENFFNGADFKRQNKIKDGFSALLCDLAGMKKNKRADNEIPENELCDIRSMMPRQIRQDDGKKQFLISKNITQDVNGRDVLFTYINDDIQSLLNDEGAMLETYIYHKAGETRLFDDFAGHIHVQNRERDLDNEMDLVATKGFRSLIIECKDRPNLNQDFYYKLASLEHLFGVNSQSMVVTTASANGQGNAKQIERGNMMGIITVSGHDAIDAIGEVMREYFQ